MTKTQHIFNLDFVAADNFDEIIDSIIKEPTPDHLFPVVITPNVDLTVHLNKNKKLFQVYIKAEVARHVWDNSHFYPIFNETNEVLQQAIKLFDRIPDLNRGKM